MLSRLGILGGRYLFVDSQQQTQAADGGLERRRGRCRTAAEGLGREWVCVATRRSAKERDRQDTRKNEGDAAGIRSAEGDGKGGPAHILLQVADGTFLRCP